IKEIRHYDIIFLTIGVMNKIIIEYFCRNRLMTITPLYILVLLFLRNAWQILMPCISQLTPINTLISYMVTILYNQTYFFDFSEVSDIYHFKFISIFLT